VCFGGNIDHLWVNIPRRLTGKTLGRPSTLNEEQKQGVRNDLAKEMSVSAIARKFGTSRQTVMRVRNESSRSVRP
jgi:putative DNA-invertase from lambdoid prophage Rac